MIRILLINSTFKQQKLWSITTIYSNIRLEVRRNMGIFVDKKCQEINVWDPRSKDPRSKDPYFLELCDKTPVSCKMLLLFTSFFADMLIYFCNWHLVSYNSYKNLIKYDTICNIIIHYCKRIFPSLYSIHIYLQVVFCSSLLFHGFFYMIVFY